MRVMWSYIIDQWKTIVYRTVDRNYKPRQVNGRWIGYGWFEFPDWNLVLGMPPKNGTSAVKEYVWQCDINCTYIERDKVTEKRETYFVVRNPVAKFKSLWRNKCLERTRGPVRYKQWAALEGATPEKLMSVIEQGLREVHWTPQAELLGDIRATLMPLPEFSAWWTNRGYGDIESFIPNKTVDDTVFDDELIERIETFYADDVELYNNAVSLWEPTSVF